jgi:hypothetical protein
MTTACERYFESLHAAAGNVLTASFDGPRADAMAKCHAFVDDVNLWIQELSERPECGVLKLVLREYQFGLLALTMGQYRSAFSSLRLALELGLAAIQWSANERELREWKLGRRDSNWTAIVDAENGVLSKAFIRLFSDGLAEEASTYRASAQTVYRECSEYVHGNAHTHQTIPEQLVFDASSFEAWQQKSSVVRLVLMFAMASRYLQDLDISSKTRLDSVISDHLGHSAGIRAMLGATVER